MSVLDLKDVFDTLKCVRCRRVPDSSPIRQCEKGHALCQGCYEALEICPACKPTQTTFLVETRNFLAEKVFEKLPRNYSSDSGGEKTLCQMTILLSELKTVLECPVCLEVPSVPSTKIYQCNSGHVICSNCHNEVEACPTCRGLLGLRRRNLTGEKLIENLPRSCKHLGCEVQLLKGIEDHENECEFRFISCCILSCKKIIPFRDLWNHTEKEHDISTGDDSIWDDTLTFRLESLKTSVYWQPIRLELNGENFIVQCHKNEEGLWGIWVVNDNKAYKCKILVISVDGERKLSYEGPCTSSSLDSEDQVLRSGLSFDTKTALKYCYVNSKNKHRMHYQVNVFKK